MRKKEIGRPASRESVCGALCPAKFTESNTVHKKEQRYPVCVGIITSSGARRTLLTGTIVSSVSTGVVILAREALHTCEKHFSILVSGTLFKLGLNDYRNSSLDIYIYVLYIESPTLF